VSAVRLSVGREARRELAFCDAWEARHGDPDVYRQRLAELVELNARLFAEQRAEAGYLPETLDGCIAVLHVAASVIDALWGGDDADP
jgi:hypothetical protein